MCPVIDGQQVSAAVTNPAFIDAQVDSTGVGKVTLANTDTANSGGTINNVQRELNGLDSFSGRAANASPTSVPSYFNNQIGSVGDPIKSRVDTISGAFAGTGGHHHDGTNGQGSLIPGNAASITWIEDGAIPLSSIEFHNQVYEFQSGLSQTLYALVKVPASYYSKQIFLRLSFYSPDTSGTAFMQTTATLVRSGVDAIGSTANQRTSTNVAVMLSGGTLNIPQIVSLDLSSTSGMIGSASISENDLIIICLTRGTDTATSDLKVPVFGAEVTFV